MRNLLPAATLLFAVLQISKSQYHYDRRNGSPNLIPQSQQTFSHSTSGIPHSQQSYSQSTSGYPQSQQTFSQSTSRIPQSQQTFSQSTSGIPQSQQTYATVVNQLLDTPGRIQTSISDNRLPVGQVQIKGPIRTTTTSVTTNVPSISLESILDQEWEAFKLTYNKRYRTIEEDSLRREIYISNRHKIAKFQQAFAKGQMTFTTAINGFADMLQHEFTNVLNGFNVTVDGGSQASQPIDRSSTFIPRSNVQFPQHVDWRMVGAVSPVRHQGACAGCWAFASAGALEGQTFRKTGRLPILSPQNLIDCTPPHGNNGCKGGKLAPAYQYVKVNPGLDTEESYPYEAKDNQCRFNPNTIGADETGYIEVTRGDEQALEDAVATVGPVSVAIDAGQESFQFYSGGVYYDKNCNNELEKLNHAVLVVGYGTEPSGEKYWLIKNSYGEQWGEGGYIKIAKNNNNHCGVASWASYPLV